MSQSHSGVSCTFGPPLRIRLQGWRRAGSRSSVRPGVSHELDGAALSDDTITLPLAGYPGISRFVLEWMRGNAAGFLPRREMPHRSGPRGTDELVNAIVESNRRWGLSVRDDVGQWARGGSVTIVAGQQTGFAGGPLYTLAKIASILKLKREHEAAGRPAIAFFWLATEDHDYSEVATLSLPSRTKQQTDLVRLRSSRGMESKHVVGTLPVPESLTQKLLALYGMERPAWLRQGINFRDSFAELIAEVAGDEIVLIDSLLPELRRAGLPLFEQIVRREPEIQADIAGRSRALEEAGFTPQITSREGEPYTLFFRLDANGNRQPFDGRAVDPETISTSALTRPLLQDAVLEPDIFVGGPAEVSYYAQIAGLHEILGVPMPRIALRGHALVAPQRIFHVIEQFDLDPVDLFSSADCILEEREPAMAGAIHEITANAQRDLAVAIERIGELALPADHSVARSVRRSIEHIEYHFRKLSERAIRAVVRKDRERHAAVQRLVSALHPDRHVQDRVTGWFHYWREYDGTLLERLVADIEPDTASFSIIPL